MRPLTLLILLGGIFSATQSLAWTINKGFFVTFFNIHSLNIKSEVTKGESKDPGVAGIKKLNIEHLSTRDGPYYLENHSAANKLVMFQVRLTEGTSGRTALFSYEGEKTKDGKNCIKTTAGLGPTLYGCFTLFQDENFARLEVEDGDIGNVRVVIEH